MGFFNFGGNQETAPQETSEMPVEATQEENTDEPVSNEGALSDDAMDRISSAKENLFAIREQLGFNQASNDEFVELLRNLLDEMDERPDTIGQLYDDRTQTQNPEGGEETQAEAA